MKWRDAVGRGRANRNGKRGVICKRLEISRSRLSIKGRRGGNWITSYSDTAWQTSSCASEWFPPHLAYKRSNLNQGKISVYIIHWFTCVLHGWSWFHAVLLDFDIECWRSFIQSRCSGWCTCWSCISSCAKRIWQNFPCLNLVRNLLNVLYFNIL